jgi:hypothetical protein
MREEFIKDMENLRKRIKQKSGNKKFLKSNTKYMGKSLQHTRTSGRQNLRT